MEVRTRMLIEGTLTIWLRVVDDGNMNVVEGIKIRVDNSSTTTFKNIKIEATGGKLVQLLSRRLKKQWFYSRMWKTKS
jgi:hypothetical protein